MHRGMAAYMWVSPNPVKVEPILRVVVVVVIVVRPALSYGLEC